MYVAKTLAVVNEMREVELRLAQQLVVQIEVWPRAVVQPGGYLKHVVAEQMVSMLDQMMAQ